MTTSSCRIARGFSLVLVLLAVLVITVIATAAIRVSRSDRMAAEVRATAGLARQTAEAGLAHFGGNVQPTLLQDQRVAVEEEFADPLSGAPLAGPIELPAPPGYAASYTVWGGANAGFGNQVIVEGQISPAGEPGRVIARSRVSAIFAMTSGDEGYTGTIGWTPRSTGVLTPGGAAPGYSGL